MYKPIEVSNRALFEDSSPDHVFQQGAQVKGISPKT